MYLLADGRVRFDEAESRMTGFGVFLLRARVELFGRICQTVRFTPQHDYLTNSAAIPQGKPNIEGIKK